MDKEKERCSKNYELLINVCYFVLDGMPHIITFPWNDQIKQICKLGVQIIYRLPLIELYPRILH